MKKENNDSNPINEWFNLSLILFHHEKEMRYLVPGDYMADPAVHIFNDKVYPPQPRLGERHRRKR